MSDPTEIVITATFLSALFLFVVALVLNWRSLRAPQHEPDVNGDLAILPPPLPVGRVATWFYHPLDLLGLGLVFMMFFGLVISSLRIAGEKTASMDPQNLVVAIAFQFIIAAIVTAFVITRVRPTVWLGLKWREWPWIFLIAPSTVLAMWMVFGVLQFSGFMEWIESFGVEAVQDSVKLLQDSEDPLTLGLMISAAVVAAPLCEEIVFRGYLYGASKRFAGPWVAGLVSALIFAAAHASLAALIPLFLFGCVLAYLYEKTGSLWAPIAVHFCFNAATVIVQMSARYLEIPLTPAS